MTEREYITQSLTKIRRFVRKYEVHIWVVAQPAKLRKLDNGNYPVPIPYGISNSAHWRNKADNCLTVWGDMNISENSLVGIYVQKIRFKNIGCPGKAELK